MHPHCPRALKLSLLPRIFSSISYRNYSLAHFSQHTRWSYSSLPALPASLIFQQHPEAISSHFLFSVAEHVVLLQVKVLADVRSLPHKHLLVAWILWGSSASKWTLHTLLQDTEERWAHTTQEMNKETLKCKFKKEKGTSNENLFLKWQSWVTSPCYASLLRDNSHLLLFPTFHKSISLGYKLMSIAGLTLPKCMSL